MKWLTVSLAVLLAHALCGQGTFLPPYHFQVDSVSLVATWQSPRMVLLDEDFEGVSFPPDGWTDTTLGQGWHGVEDPVYQNWLVPEHEGSFALTNDDAAGYSNDGSQDLLLMPALDLTVANWFTLTFDSYFDAGYGEQATLEYSIDGGSNWDFLLDIPASLKWEKIGVNLIDFSGPGGSSSFQIRFHADDQGYFASGWAVDNVEVYSTDTELPLGYGIFLGSEQIDQVTGNSYTFYIEYSSTENCGVVALYEGGHSDTLWKAVHSAYLAPPTNLVGSVPDDAAILFWLSPTVPVEISYKDISEVIPDNILGFNLYKNGEFLAYSAGYEPIGSTNSYTDPLPEPGFYTYEVSAIYDMTEYGFPGDSAESDREGPAFVSCPVPTLELDFYEDWENYLSNHWTIPENEWLVDQQIGNGAPAAVFMPDSSLSDYESSLKSAFFLVFVSPGAQIQLSYDVSLSSIQTTGNETLDVQVGGTVNDDWTTLASYSNIEGSFDWKRDTIDITNYLSENFFRIRFLAHGVSSDAIESWALDNIAVTLSCQPPTDVTAAIGPEPEDSILVTWQEPWPTLEEWREWDDGIQDETIGFGVGKEAYVACAARWTSEDLEDLKGARLTAIGFIPGEASTFYKATVWTGDEKELVRIQAVDNLIVNEWNIITLDPPLEVDITRDLVVGYQFSRYTGYSMSLDAGPAVDGYGNLLQFGQGQPWTTLLEINPETDRNWNIKAYFERDSIPVQGYELYRSFDGGDYELIAEPFETSYLDPVLNWNATYCYALKAVYPDQACTSGLSGESCITVTSVGNFLENDGGFLNIYPNPSEGKFTLESSEEILRISIYNVSGRMIFSEEMKTFRKEIHLEEGPGIYFMRVQTDRDSYYQKVILY